VSEEENVLWICGAGKRERPAEMVWEGIDMVLSDYWKGLLGLGMR
jgi:hypothetical protein